MSLNTSTASAAVANGATSTIPAAVATKARGAGYSRIEDLLICKAFIASSEDSQKGAYKKTKIFQSEMHKNYTKLLCEQERVDSKSIRTSNAVTSNTTPDVVYDRRTASAIMDRFRKVISFRVMKFVAIEATTEKASGNCINMYFDVCNDIFQKRHPLLGNFNDFRLCKEYLSEKPKWTDFATQECQREVKKERPTGGKKDKKIKEETAMVKSVLNDLNPNNNGNKNDGSAVFYERAGEAMTGIMHQLKQQNELKMVDLFTSPQKRKWKDAQFELMMEETAAKKAALKSVTAAPKASDDDGNDCGSN